MKKQTRNIIALIMAVFMAVGVISACGGSGSGTATTTAAAATTAAATTAAATTAAATTAAATTAAQAGGSTMNPPGVLPIVEGDRITVTAFWPGNATVLARIETYNDATIWPIIEEETNIHIEFIHGNQEQFNLMLSTNDLADIMYAPNNDFMYPGGGDKAIADGAYLRLNEILNEWSAHYLPLIESTPMFRRDTRTDTGNIWGFSMVETRIQGAFTGMTIRQDWLDELGLDTPVTYDDWYHMLTRFKEDLGATAPLLLPERLFPDNGVLSAGFGVSNTFYQDSGTVKFGPVEPAFREFIEMLRLWYAEGLIDSEFITRDGVSRDQLIYTMQAGAWHDGFWRLNYNSIHAEDGDVFHQVAVPNPVRNEGDRTHLRQNNHNVRGQWAAVSANAKHPVETVRWLDNLYSQSNWLLTNYGVEGHGFTYVDGEPVLSDLILRNPDGLLIAEALVQFAMHSGPMWREWDREWPGWYPDEIAAEGIWNTATADQFIPTHLISPTAEESEESARIMADVNTYVLEMCTRFVMGMEDMGNFDSFVAQIYNMDIELAIKNMQSALDRYYARN